MSLASPVLAEIRIGSIKCFLSVAILLTQFGVLGQGFNLPLSIPSIGMVPPQLVSINRIATVSRIRAFMSF
jgi:hypothetical protein